MTSETVAIHVLPCQSKARAVGLRRRCPIMGAVHLSRAEPYVYPGEPVDAAVASELLLSLFLLLDDLGVVGRRAGLLAAQDDMSDAVSHARGLSRAFREAAETAMPSVVTLITKSKPDCAGSDLRRLLDDPRFRRLFPRDELPGEPPDGQSVPEHPTIPQVGLRV